MVIVFQIVIGLILIAALIQTLKIAKFPNSKITLGWLASAAIIVILSEVFLYSFIDDVTEQAIFLALVTVSLLANFIKFSFGYIQKKEVTAYNRFEHFIAGLILFYAASLVNIIQLFGMQSVSRLGSGLIIVAFVNLSSVVFEVSELALDKIKGEKHLIGPSVYDTSFDLLMLLLGSILGLIIWVFIE